MRNPLLRLKLHFIYLPLINALQAKARPVQADQPDTPMMRILDLARWAPSGDNTQPWLFEVHNEHQITVKVLIEGKDDPDPFVSYADRTAFYYISGILLETLRIAATTEGMIALWEYKGEKDNYLVFSVSLKPDEATTPNPLSPYIKTRYTNRKPYHQTPLTDEQKKALDSSVSGVLDVHWHEGSSSRKQMARLSMRVFAVRMANQYCCTHIVRDMDFKHVFSRDGLPVKTLNMTLLSRKLMQFAMHSSKRLLALCRLPFATFLPAMEVEYMPNTHCAAHVMLSRAQSRSDSSSDPLARIKDGEAIGRFWLTAAKFGLNIQPNYALLAFAYYGRNDLPIQGSTARSNEKIAAFAKDFDATCHAKPDQITFVGRIGKAKTPAPLARSVRKPLQSFLVNDNAQNPIQSGAAYENIL